MKSELLSGGHLFLPTSVLLMSVFTRFSKFSGSLSRKCNFFNVFSHLFVVKLCALFLVLLLSSAERRQVTRSLSVLQPGECENEARCGTVERLLRSRLPPTVFRVRVRVRRDAGARTMCYAPQLHAEVAHFAAFDLL